MTLQDSFHAPTPSGDGWSLGASLFRLFHQRKLKQYAGIPGPTPSFPTGTALDFQKGRPTWEVLGQYGKEYGGISLLWMLTTPSLVLNDPNLISQVLLTLEQQAKNYQPSRCPVTQAMNFYKDLPRKALRPMLTDTSTFVAKDQGSIWQHLSANNPFNLSYFDDWLDQNITLLKDFIQQRIETFDTTSISAYDTIQKLTFDGFSLATTGEVFPANVFQQFRYMCEVGTQRMTRSSLSNHLIPTTPWGSKYRKVSQQWFARFSQVVATAQSNPAPNSLIAWILERGESDFSPEQLRNFLAGVYPGGAVSAPSGITSALHLLWQNPDTLPPLHRELDHLFSQPLTLERLNQCQILDQVLRETLRLKPPVAFFTRNVGNDNIQLDGHDIPAHTQIFITNWYLQRHPDHWPDPEQFKPSRWDQNTCENNPYGSGYFFPFGRGDRACIGQSFAKVFMKLSLAVLLHERQVTFGPEPDAPEFHFAVAVPRQLRMQLHPRS